MSSRCNCQRYLYPDESFFSITVVACSSSAGPSSATASTPSLSPSISQSSLFPSNLPSPSLSLHSQAKPTKSIDLAHLTSLLYHLAKPKSVDPKTPSLTPRLRGNGSLREPALNRAERRHRFIYLLDTFHKATICDFKPESYTLSASDLLSALDQDSPVGPNDVLRGVTSSMSEPAVKHEAGALPTAENPGKLIAASGIAAPYQELIKEAIQARIEQGRSRPKLVSILATPSPPSVAYAEWTRKACEAVGIDFQIWKTWDEAAKPYPEEHKGSSPDFDLEADVEDLIIAANSDDSIHGIMVYYPIFHGRQDTYLQQIVDPRKDVEGLHFSYCWNMYHNVRWVAPSQLGGAPGTTRELPEDANAITGEQVPPGMVKSILPCTPLAMVKCLESIGVYDRNLPYGDPLYGKTITIINRSEVVGRPLAALLSNDGAQVYSVDIDSIQDFNKRAEDADLRARSAEVKDARTKNSASRLRPHHVVRNCSLSAEECVRASDVVISGVPAASYKVPTEWIKQGATCINFSSEKNFDKDIRTRAGMYLPAIGKTTIAMLQRNLLRLAEYRELEQ